VANISKLTAAQVVAMAKAQGLSEEQTAGLVKALAGEGALKASTAKGEIVRYTTKAGKQDVYLSVPSGRVFIKASEAKAIVETLTTLLARAEKGEVDTVKAAAQ
jgi:hypothetical protein